MEKTLIIHQQHHPKELSRSKSQDVFQKLGRLVFRDLPDVDIAIIVCHQLESSRDLVVPSSIKYCEGDEIQANACISKNNNQYNTEKGGVDDKVEIIFTDNLVTDGIIECLKSDF